MTDKFKITHDSFNQYLENLTQCDHENIDWDWSSCRPAVDCVVVPGQCQDCSKNLQRRYTFDQITEP